MKITILYFSQTGNTRKVSSVFYKTLIEKKHAVRYNILSDIKVKDIEWADVIGIGSPSFGSGAPSFIKTFLNNLPLLSGKKAFVYATGFGAAGNVLLDIKKILVQKNASVIAGYLSVGEMHHPAPSLKGKMANRPNEDDLQKAKEFILGLSDYLTGSITNTSDISGNIDIKSKMGFYNFVGLLASSKKVLHILEPKPVLNEKKCIQCNLCIKECPVKCISSGIFPEIKHKDCIRCYRCLNVCPQKAISANWFVRDKALGFLYNEKLMRAFGEYEE